MTEYSGTLSDYPESVIISKTRNKCSKWQSTFSSDFWLFSFRCLRRPRNNDDEISVAQTNELGGSTDNISTVPTMGISTNKKCKQDLFSAWNCINKIRWHFGIPRGWWRRSRVQVVANRFRIPLTENIRIHCDCSVSIHFKRTDWWEKTANVHLILILI